MRTRSKLAAVLLALFSAAAARGENGVGVIIVCPKNAMIGVTQFPAGWGSGLNGDEPFKAASISDGKLWCGYGLPNAYNSTTGSMTRPVPNGMTCSVNATNPLQFDCLPHGSNLDRNGKAMKVPTPGKLR
jgi:hypothetical protein